MLEQAAPGTSYLGALSETLRQLLEARQDRTAASLLERCGRDTLQQLAAFPSVQSHARTAYLCRKQLGRASTRPSVSHQDDLREIAGIFNLWCAEGRRRAIRSVLREMPGDDLRALAEGSVLNGEVTSMLRDFMA